MDLRKYCMYLNNTCNPIEYIEKSYSSSSAFFLGDHSFTFDVARPLLANVSCSLPVTSHPTLPRVAELSSARLRSAPQNRPCSFLPPLPVFMFSHPLSPLSPFSVYLPLGWHLTHRSHHNYSSKHQQGPSSMSPCHQVKPHR